MYLKASNKLPCDRRHFIKSMGLSASSALLLYSLPAMGENKNNSTIIEKNLTLNKQHLLLPIKTGQPKAQIDLVIDNFPVRQFDAEIAADETDVTFWAFLDITAFKNKTATLQVKGASSDSFAMIKQGNNIPGHDNFYTERLRPQFHFSQIIGWNNDPNGMVYHNGKWHLYFQHNPYGFNWGNMHWGHATSTDLIHWTQQPIAIYNKRRGDWAFSGGATVDVNNTAGFQTGSKPPIIASWTSTGRGECISYSNDDGLTFTEYENNPVVKHKGRDPKIIWFAPGKHWVMAVYDESEDHGKAIAIYNSDNMKDWQLTSRITGYYECPEIFELPIDGDKGITRWVIFGGDAQYTIGTFDGKTFTPDHKGTHRVHFGSYYASQVFSNVPNGRIIQIGWARINMQDMPFNQTFTLPHELSLRTTEDGIRMFAEPIKEIEKIYGKQHVAQQENLTPDSPAILNVTGDIFDITATFQLGEAKAVGLNIGGNIIEYNIEKQTLQQTPLKPIDGNITLRVLIDRPMIETIGNNGAVYITSKREKTGNIKAIEAFTKAGNAKLINLKATELKSIWK